MNGAIQIAGFPSAVHAEHGFAMTWGGVRGGGTPYLEHSAIPPSLSLPHEGGGNVVARSKNDGF
jgi:hypothetical protein